MGLVSIGTVLYILHLYSSWQPTRQIAVFPIKKLLYIWCVYNSFDIYNLVAYSYLSLPSPKAPKTCHPFIHLSLDLCCIASTSPPAPTLWSFQSKILLTIDILFSLVLFFSLKRQISEIFQCLSFSHRRKILLTDIYVKKAKYKKRCRIIYPRWQSMNVYSGMKILETNARISHFLFIYKREGNGVVLPKKTLSEICLIGHMVKKRPAW